MTLLSLFISAVKSNNLFTLKDKLIVAVSGGVDSVVLCDLCKQAGYSFIIAHCNFQLRGEESERDELFVRNLGEKHGVQVLVKKFDTEQFAKENKLSIQEAARNLRYTWFFDLWYKDLYAMDEPTVELREQVPGWHVPPYRIFVLTAHHADDNTETLLMNFLRGTGLHGLTGIPVSGPSDLLNYIRRPLLSFFKEDLLAYAKENQLEFVEDSSNKSSKYTRNFFRNEIIPAITKVYPAVKENLRDNISRFKEIERLYNFMLTGLKKKLCRVKGDEIHIPVKQLMGYNNRALIYEVIAEYGFSEKQVEEVVKLSSSESGKFISSGSYRIIKHRHWLIISPVSATEVSTMVIEENDKTIIFPAGVLKLEVDAIPGAQIPTNSTVASLDSKEISFPIILRKWKTGDYFYPLGMKRKKKVARFLIDQKLSKSAKEDVWVIESNKRIAWIVGHRIDNRFKMTAATKKVLLLRLNTGHSQT